MPNLKPIEKRVAEVNALIAIGKSMNVEVVDNTSTWQSPMVFNQLKYSRGVLYVTYKELDLYNYLKGRGTKWEKKSERYGNADAKEVLTYIARMYRRAIK